MFAFFLTLILLLGVVLIVIVLLQAGKGGGLAAMGGGAGTETFVGGRQAATILTKATWIGGGAFLFLALVLSVISSRYERMDPILREEFRPTVPQQVEPTPVLPIQPGEGTGEGAPGAETPPSPEG